MDAGFIKTITELIGSLGLPVVMCGYLLWLNNKQRTENSENIHKLETAVNNSTAAIREVLEFTKYCREKSEGDK